MLRANQVAFRYPQEGRGLPPASLEVAAGEIALFTGPSGCGKSTLARCLIGLIPHLYHGQLSGEVWLNGYRTSDAPLWQLTEKAGMVFQNPAGQMLASTVEEEILFGLENLGLPRSEMSARLESALTQFGLQHFRRRNPQTLSGGEQQKLALAAVTARDPAVLVLDEPLSMLDSTAAGELVRYLGDLARQGRAVTVFEHRREYLDTLPGLRVLSLDGARGESLRGAASLPRGLNLPPKASFRLELEGVSVKLGERAPLQNLNLSLPSGQWVAVVGRNGVGKTTLLRALAGLQAYSGRVQVIGADGAQSPGFGMVFQNPDLQLFNPSVRAEILYRLPDPDLAYYAALLQVLGLETYEHTPPLLLSEGEKKRLALALVLMRRPAHGVLLDEPSLGQDGAHKAILGRVLRALAEAGQLVVMTTHDLSLAAQADRLVLLGFDGVVAQGATPAVLRDEAAWAQAGIVLPEWFRRQEGLP